MKPIDFIIISTLFMGALSQHVQSQTIRYPKEVKAIYDKADQAAQLTKQQQPIIGIPASDNTQTEVSKVEP